MLGLVYLILSTIIGYYIIKMLLPEFVKVVNFKTLNGKETELSSWIAILPASWAVGTLIVTWITYMASYAFKDTGKPMMYGNIISFVIFGALVIFFIFTDRNIHHNLFTCFKTSHRSSHNFLKSIKSFVSANKIFLIFISIATIIYSFLMFNSFYIKNGIMRVGFSVYSDFGPHLSMIRSFSKGLNFPTEYPHFADGHVRYHFFFQFLAGNLEFLGLRLDWAFNLPSILAMIFYFMLLYSFAVILLGKKWIGIMTVCFCIFRSSYAFFGFLSEKISEQNSLKNILIFLKTNQTHIGKTPYEEWGLWAQKTFINQRHYAFGMCILLITLIALYPIFRKMVVIFKNKTINEFLISKDSWLPKSYIRPIFIGIILGLATFWNGAIVIATLFILFIMALFSKHRLEYLIVAVIAVLLSNLETAFFFGSSSSAVDPKLTIGFVAPERDFIGIFSYYMELLGVMPIVVIAGILILPKLSRFLAIALLAPLVVGTMLQLTPDVVVNHKYVIVSVILLNIFAAGFLYKVFSTKKSIAYFLGAVLIFAMTSTGVVDMLTLKNIDSLKSGSDVNDPILKWVEQNTKPNEIFLTDIYVTHPILLAGRKLFYGWPYFAWSAGYETDSRSEVQKKIYGSTNSDEVSLLAKENRINYIVIDEGNRNSKDYVLNEDLIKNTFEQVYSNEQGKIQIYKVKW